MARASLLVALLATILTVGLAQDDPAGLTRGADLASPFLNKDARAAQFGYTSPNSGEFCVGSNILFGGATTFEAWIVPTQKDGGIITTGNFGAANAVADMVSFRVVNWRLQLFISGKAYDGTDSTMKVDSLESLLPQRWTRVFGVIKPDVAAKTTTVCVIFESYTPATGASGHVVSNCQSGPVAFPESTRSHIYVGDDSAARSTITNFRGLIESVRIWKAAFTAEEAHALIAIPASESRLRYQWTFDECPTLLGCVPTATDSAGGSTPNLLSCGSGSCAKSPRCVLTNNPVNQVGGFEVVPGEPQPMGSGRTLPPPLRTLPPPLIATTIPPVTSLKCPPPAAAMFYGDPHITLYDTAGKQASVFDFNEYGWYWIASTTLPNGEVIGVQIEYVDCGGPTTCPGAVAWRNKREMGWWSISESRVTITNDGTAVAWNAAGVTTPMGSLVQLGVDNRRNPYFKLTIPGAFSLVGSTAGDPWLYFTTHWTINFDSAFGGMAADGKSCLPSSARWGTVKVREADKYYRGRVPPQCTDCVVPPADMPPVCPKSAVSNSECGGVAGVRCVWDAAKCPCIVDTCYNEDFVSPLHRSACLTDASQGQSLVPSMEASFQECMGALRILLATLPAPTLTDPRLLAYKCRAGKHCPGFCGGPCRGTCNADGDTCTCKTGWTGRDCSTAAPRAPGRKRDVANQKDLSGFIQDIKPAATFYSYDAATLSASAANKVQAAGLASFFLHTQISPPYPLETEGTLPMFSDAVTTFGVTFNRFQSGRDAKLAIDVKIRNAVTDAPVTGAGVQLKDDVTDSYSWNAATATGSFSWSTGSTGTDGMLLGPLPPPQNGYCVDVTITSAAGISTFAVFTGDKDDKDVPRMHLVPANVGDSFTICSMAASDPCIAHTECGTCNAVAECGWCDSSDTCLTGDAAGPADNGNNAMCTTWRSESDSTASRIVEHRMNADKTVRTTQIRAYLAPDNVPVTVPVWIALPPTPASFVYQVRGLFEFTDKMSVFYAKFLTASGNAFASAINQVSPGSTMAVASFRDKAHVQPHGRAGDWVYKEHSSFQRTDVSSVAVADFATWGASPALVSDFKPELGLATLEALFHEPHHGWPLTPAVNTKNVVLIFTKSPIARAGINIDSSDATNVALGVPLPANNADENVDDYEDYPTEIQTARSLISRGIIPVFVVPDATGSEEVLTTYRDLVNKWGFGKVWPDFKGRNAIRSDMSTAEGTAVLANILADLASTVQIVSADPEVTTTLASPALASVSDLPLGSVVPVYVTLQRNTAQSRKRDLDAELYRLFYKDRRLVSVMGVGSFEVVSATTDAPSAEDISFSIQAGSTDTAAHILAISSYSIYDQSLTAYVTSQPGEGISIWNVQPGTMPEVKGAALSTDGKINDVLRRVYVDVPAGLVGNIKNGFVVATFRYKTVDPCGLESRVGTISIRVVPAGVYPPERSEPASVNFEATVNENTISKPTSTLVCVGGIDYDGSSSLISTKLITVPEQGALFHVVDAKGTAGVHAKAGDVVQSAMGAKEAPAVACYVYVPPVRDSAHQLPFGPGYGSFSWQLQDGTGLVSTIETTPIHVMPINYPPIAADATITGWQNTPLFIDLSATDDPRDDGINGGAVTVQLIVNPTKGALVSKEGVPIRTSVALSGSPVTVKYSPAQDATSIVDLAGALNVFDFFTYLVTDAGGLTASATVRIYVNPTTNMPTLAFEIGTLGTFPVAPVSSGKPVKVCLTVANLKNSAETGVYITALPTQGAVTTGSGKHQTPIPLDVSASGAYCFYYKMNSGAFGTDSIGVKVCDSCGPASGSSFNSLLAAAPASSVTMNLPEKSRAAKNQMSGGAVAGIAVGAIIAAVILLAVLIVVVRARAHTQSPNNSSLKAPLL